MTTLISAALIAITTLGPADAPWCGMSRITAYVRSDYGPAAKTFDGTSIFTSEAIAAGSWDIRLGAIAHIDGVGSFRIADRGGGLGNGTPMPWVDIAVWDRATAYQLTGVRHVCFRRSVT